MKFSTHSKNKGLPSTTFGITKSGAGFTLIELIVVMAVATVVMTSVVIQQNVWNDRLAVNTQAYELVLMIRQAQIYALGVREDKAGTETDKFNIGYGVYFDTVNTRYIYFADRNGNLRYDSGEEIGSPIIFTRGVTIKDVCGSSMCIYTGGGSFRQANISFFRPNPGAIIKLLNNGGGNATNPPVTISLQSAGGKVYSVTVRTNGQVSVIQI